MIFQVQRGAFTELRLTYFRLKYDGSARVFPAEVWWLRLMYFLAEVWWLRLMYFRLKYGGFG